MIEIHDAHVFENITYKSNVLGLILREARRQTGLSLRGLAELSGVSASQIHNIETNKYDVSLENYLRICLCLGLPPGLPLEDALFPKFSFYGGVIASGDCPEGFGSDVWENFSFREFAASYMGCCAAIYQYILSISYPVAYCARIDYPSKEVEIRYKELAQKITAYSSLDRLNEVIMLKEHPLRTLAGNGLVFHSLIMDLHGRLLEGEKVDLWLPLFNEESIKFLK